MPRTKKTADVKATETKTPEVKEVVNATPVEEAIAPAKTEPKKAGRKPAAKKTAPAKSAKVVTTSVLQVAGNEFDFDKVVKAVEGLKKKAILFF